MLGTIEVAGNKLHCAGSGPPSRAGPTEYRGPRTHVTSTSRRSEKGPSHGVKLVYSDPMYPAPPGAGARGDGTSYLRAVLPPSLDDAVPLLSARLLS